MRRAELTIIMEAIILSFVISLGLPFLGVLILTLAYSVIGRKGKAILQAMIALWVGFDSAVMIESMGFSPIGFTLFVVAVTAASLHIVGTLADRVLHVGRRLRMA